MNFQRIFIFVSFQKWNIWNCFGMVFIVIGKYFMECYGMMLSKQIYSTKLHSSYSLRKRLKLF